MNPINRFDGDYYFLSNFYPCPVMMDTIIYDSSEHAYQAAKTLDKSEREKVASCATANEAKKMGKVITLRSNWEAIKLDIMEKIVTDKFKRNPILMSLLIATGDAILIEGNYWHDEFWGVYQGKGENHLGLILMKVREDCK